MSDGLTRRNALKLAGATLGAGAFARALAPLATLTEHTNADDFLQRHYRELDAKAKHTLIARLEAETERKYGTKVTIRDFEPNEGVQFAYALNLSVCIGCRRCAEACHEENNHDRRTHQSYIRVLEMDQGSLDLANGNVHYDHAVPAPGKFYVSVHAVRC